MTWSMRMVVALAVCAMSLLPALAEDVAKPTVEIRFVETKVVEGLTEEEGFQSSCDPDSMVYPHKKPALVLTAAEVANVELKHLDLSKNGLSPANYMVNIRLTKDACAKLAAACEGNEMRLVTIVVDGKYWGVHRYEKDKEKKFVPESARAETFEASVGYFSSHFQASRLAKALR